MLKNIIYIHAGPIYRPHSPLYQAQYIEISKRFRGYIITTSPNNEVVNIKNFQYISINSNVSKSRVIKLLFKCILMALKLRIKGEKVDLVTTYDPLSVGLIGLLISYILNAKFSPEVKGVYDSSFEWVDNINSLETKIKKVMYPIIMRFVLKRSDGIIHLFKGQIDNFKEVTQGKVIHHFSSYVAVHELKNIRDDKEILFVGRPFKRKGVDILIAAFKKVAPKYPEWKLKILGWYPNTDELYKAIGGHPQIYHHKPVPHQQMVEHIGACAMLVLPSRSEAMGRVLVEAMAAGKPRIGSRVDGIPTVINDGLDGLLFEPENIDDLADKLDMLMSNPEMRKKLGHAGEVRAKEEFTTEIYCNNLANFYDEVLKY